MISSPTELGRQLVLGTGVHPILPDWHALMAAFCGHIGDQPDAHPVTQCARALAETHHAYRGFSQGGLFYIGTCEVLVASIDAWVDLHAPHADRCPRLLGAAVDEMALAQLDANETLRTCRDGRDERVHAAFHRLAILAGRWTDLVAEVVDGQPPFPKDEHR
ncbi:DUF4254 domain-containing protein [Nocardia sp. NPDC059239]|uniref:DUF4254 domain-containing protein n=1 Tax=unclassified Nocardia TaxID=2637762 RepID=UPI003680725D